MQKMKNGLMMFCLTVLLSCAALMMNTPTASAMGLADLQGDYRLVKIADWMPGIGCRNKGLIISWVRENGDYLGIVKKTVNEPDCHNKVGDQVITGVYVENGIVHCSLNYTPGLSRNDCTLRIYNNGATLQVIDDDNTVAWELHRL